MLLSFRLIGLTAQLTLSGPSVVVFVSPDLEAQILKTLSYCFGFHQLYDIGPFVRRNKSIFKPLKRGVPFFFENCCSSAETFLFVSANERLERG